MENLSNFDFAALGTMCQWEREKALYLMQTAENIGLEYADSFGHIAVNNSSGNVYLWSENYAFCIYMPINCELSADYVFVCYTDLNDGLEYEQRLSVFIEMASDPERRHIFNPLDAIQQWIEEVEAGKGADCLI